MIIALHIPPPQKFPTIAEIPSSLARERPEFSNCQGHFYFLYYVHTFADRFYLCRSLPT